MTEDTIATCPCCFVGNTHTAHRDKQLELSPSHHMPHVDSTFTRGATQHMLHSIMGNTLKPLLQSTNLLNYKYGGKGSPTEQHESEMFSTVVCVILRTEPLQSSLQQKHAPTSMPPQYKHSVITETSMGLGMHRDHTVQHPTDALCYTGSSYSEVIPFLKENA